jgi:hypothetical protein
MTIEALRELPEVRIAITIQSLGVHGHGTMVDYSTRIREITQAAVVELEKALKEVQSEALANSPYVV